MEVGMSRMFGFVPWVWVVDQKWDAEVTFRGTVSGRRGLAELYAGGLWIC